MNWYILMLWIWTLSCRSPVLKEVRGNISDLPKVMNTNYPYQTRLCFSLTRHLNQRKVYILSGRQESLECPAVIGRNCKLTPATSNRHMAIKRSSHFYGRATRIRLVLVLYWPTSSWLERDFANPAMRPNKTNTNFMTHIYVYQLFT
jgi:hypothetical protein